MEFAVRDSGPGIPATELPHLFDRFYRGDRSRHLPGNGLGLSLARAVAHAHGGEIRVESSPGTGSTFILSLPTFSRATRSAELAIATPMATLTNQ